jgi:hypothetical protein
VQFEAFEATSVHPEMAANLLARSTTVNVAVNARLCDVLPFSEGKAKRRLREGRLLSLAGAPVNP